MNTIKKVVWDEPSNGPASAGSYSKGAKIPDNSYIDIGMTAYAKYNNVKIKLKITKMESKYDAIGEIVKIYNNSNTIDDLCVGDLVFINRWDIGQLLQNTHKPF